LAGAEIARSSIRGSLILFLGNLGHTGASAISIVFIARLLGPADYGVYTLALVIPSLLQNFVGLGVDTAVIRYSAYYNSIGRPDEARHFTTSAIYFVSLTGLALTVFDVVLAGVLSSFLLHRPELGPYLRLVSWAILGNALLQTVVSAAIGWSWMSLSSASQVLQSTLKLAISPVLIFAGLGVAGALVGQVISLIMAGALGAVVLYSRRLRDESRSTATFTNDVREMLGFGLAPYAGALLSALALYEATIVLALVASNTTFGLYQAAVNFLAPVTLVSAALVNALFPTFASVDGKGGNVQSAFRHAYKFVAFLLTPVIFFLISASGALVSIFYGASFGGSIALLRLLALAYLPVAFGYTVHPAFFNGFGRTRLTLVMNLGAAVTLAVGAPLFSVMLRLSVGGLILAIFLSYFVAWLVGTLLARKYMHATLDLRANGAILLISFLSYAATVVIPRIESSNALTLGIYFLVFFSTYLTLAPLAKAINRQDVDVLALAIGQLRLVGRLIAPILKYERFLLARTTKSGD
jgi:O-antigen/teichoic acid export membrane protein